MNVKAVVKVMNFHSLLRVEASRRQAEKYSDMEESLKEMMSMILGNKNLRLDRKIKEPDKNAPVLKIYFGSDFGFCGAVNVGVNSQMTVDSNLNIEQIAIGKKIKKNNEKTLLYISLEDFQMNFDIIREYLTKAIKQGKWSAIDIVYNHFHNSSNIELMTKRIYPMSIEGNKSREWDDFIVEGDADDMFEDMLILCLEYEIKIAAVSAYASENIMRQNSTTESLKRIEEIEEDERKTLNKERTKTSVTKAVDNFVKQKTLRN